MHGQHFRQTKEFSNTESQRWFRAGKVKRETEGVIMAAQTRSLRTTVVKAKIDKALPMQCAESVNSQKRR